MSEELGEESAEITMEEDLVEVTQNELETPNFEQEISVGNIFQIGHVSISPQMNYLAYEEDPCLQIENEIFNVENLLKKCEFDSEEYYSLVAEGYFLREEWDRASEEMSQVKSLDLPEYDIDKCVIPPKEKKKKPNPVNDDMEST